MTMEKPDSLEPESATPQSYADDEAQAGVAGAGGTGEPDTRLDLLYEIGRKASSVSEVSSLIAQIMSMTEQTLKASASSILMLDEEAQELYFEFAEGEVGQTLRQVRMSVESGIAGWVVRYGKPLIVNDVANDERFCEAIDRTTGFVTRAVMCAPMKVRGKTTGVIEVLNKLDGSDFDDGDLEALVSVASTAAMAIDSKRSEEALRVSEEHYAALISSLTDAVFETREGVVTWCNERVEEIYGYSREEMIGKDIRFPYPLNTGPLELNRKVSAAIKKHGRYCDSAKVKKKDGTSVDTEYTISQIAGRYPIELVAVVRDVTDRKRAEDEKRRMEQQLQLAGRLAAVGELAAGVAHELNNPLAAVQGFAQLLSQNETLDEETRIDVETIYEQAQRATRITESLLSFARKHNSEKALVSINEALERSLELHAHQMKVNNIEISLELDPELPETWADFHQMQQVFVNIVSNAEQAMTGAHHRGNLSIKTLVASETIQIIFADDGPGIPEDSLRRVFDPFFTTKEVGKGTGLGLSICYGIIRDHGGNIFVRSKAGQGAAFVVEIPIVTEEQLAVDEIQLTRVRRT
ncbi:MAG: ATP-binding protein [Dehalococcoidia bacterium]